MWYDFGSHEIDKKMSVLFSNDKGWVISHEILLRNLYQNVVRIKDGEHFALKYDDSMFDINSKFVRQNQRIALTENSDRCRQKKKRKHNHTVLDNLEEIQKVKKLYEELIAVVKSQSIFEDKSRNDFNDAARSLSQQFFCDTDCESLKNLKGSNCSEYARIIKLENREYVVPQNSTFYCYDVTNSEKMSLIDEQFDLIIMDPPWWNKSVRRKKAKKLNDSYSMLYNADLKTIPIKKLLKPNGIIGIWCTNSKSCMESILDDMFPSWGVEYRSKWYWIKVTKTGDVICDFNEIHNKQPYEILVIGSNATNNIPNDKIFLSVPSAIHSNKPPLTDMFRSYLPENPKCLEIFARYLLPGWHSLGLEVLKFQHLKLFEIKRKAIVKEDEVDDVNNS